jgi:adenylate kinase
MRIVFLGPPGAGKGTQAAVVSQKLDVPHISTGEMFRKAIAAGDALGLQVKGFIDNGNLVPDPLTLSVIEARLSQPDCKKGFVLDGFPRTLQQTQDLDRLLARLGTPLNSVVEVSVPEKVLIERMQNRARETGGARSDDNVEVFANRLKVYRDQTMPLSAYYRKKGVLREVDGLGAIEEVTSRVMAVLKGIAVNPCPV